MGNAVLKMVVWCAITFLIAYVMVFVASALVEVL
jgi:hypothetical protein